MPADAARTNMKSDICSGWRAEGTMMTEVRAGRGVPVTIGPTAPVITDETADDPLGWHAIDALPAGCDATPPIGRRARRGRRRGR